MTFKCDGKWHTQKFRIDTEEQGYGKLVQGPGVGPVLPDRRAGRALPDRPALGKGALRTAVEGRDAGTARPSSNGSNAPRQGWRCPPLRLRRARRESGRLPPQPGGFEGVGRVPASLPLHEIPSLPRNAIVHVDHVLIAPAPRVCHRARITTDSPSSASTSISVNRFSAQSERRRSNCLRIASLPRNRPGFRPSVGSRHKSVLRPPSSERLSLLKPVEGSEDELHVFLRHRPLSISLGPADRESQLSQEYRPFSIGLALPPLTVAG